MNAARATRNEATASEVVPFANTKSARPPASMSLAVTQLIVYPIKGCRGVSLSRATVTDVGLQHDREFMVVNSAGRFVTQRTHSRLALVAPQLPPGDAAPSDGALSLSAPGMPQLQVPLAPSRRRRRAPVSVWEWSGEADDEGDEAGDWFSAFLGISCRLVRFAPGARRQTDATYGDGKTLFTDGFPVLTVTEASLAALNARLAPPGVPMDRFRPNVVVGGALPFAEDGWERFRAGNAVLRGVKPCSRCKVTTIDQATGRDGGEQEPLRSLSSFRSGAALGWKEPGGGDAWRAQVFFGSNACVEAGGSLAVGDAVSVLSTRDWRAA